MKGSQLLKSKIDELNKNQVEDAIIKARELLRYELNCSKEDLIFHMDKEIEEAVQKKFEEAIQKLILGVPIQYITCAQNFFGLEFYVDRNVLIPQPDTEILVQEVLELVRKYSNKPRILDICTGSGAIAISVAKNCEAEIVASDVSQKALEVAEKNALKQKVKIQFLESDMFEKVEGKFDVIVSNPPYIETATIGTLEKEVQREPKIALDGGEDGLRFYRILVEEAPKYLTEAGILAVEIGYNQKEKVMELFQKAGFAEVYTKKDFGENPRVVVGRRKA